MLTALSDWLTIYAVLLGGMLANVYKMMYGRQAGLCMCIQFSLTTNKILPVYELKFESLSPNNERMNNSINALAFLFLLYKSSV